MALIAYEKMEVLDAIARKQNVFITGSAGTGKSFLLKLIKDKYQNHGLHVTASTGIAAVNIEGVTIHSWAGIGTGALPANEIVKYIHSGKGTHLRRKLKKAKILAIDEISMISAKIFDLLNFVLKEVRGNDLPFGGIQLILLGDFLQLPPINKEEDDKLFCFESDSWHEAGLKVFVLRQVFRQEDQFFVSLLNKMRYGKISLDDIELLKERCTQDLDKVIRPTIITTHNTQVEEINRIELAKLSSSSYFFTCEEQGDTNKLEFLKKNCLASEKLILKKGAQVMMLKNTYYKEGIINGSLGVIVDFGDKGYPIVKFSNNKVLTVYPEAWVIEEFDNINLELKVKASITQVPLTLAWAITVHKSQGMTLDKIECDLGKSFAEGQVYVALSRVKSLQGLYLRSFNPSLLKANPKVVEFYSNLEGELV